MDCSPNTSQQHYSSSLAAYTLKQFSAARAALDNDEDAAAKLPASVKTYDYQALKPSTETSSQSTSSDYPRPPQNNGSHVDKPKA